MNVRMQPSGPNMWIDNRFREVMVVKDHFSGNYLVSLKRSPRMGDNGRVLKGWFSLSPAHATSQEALGHADLILAEMSHVRDTVVRSY